MDGMKKYVFVMRGRLIQVLSHRRWFRVAILVRIASETSRDICMRIMSFDVFRKGRNLKSLSMTISRTLMTERLVMESLVSVDFIKTTTAGMFSGGFFMQRIIS
jgi:hypothetical protein